MSVIPFPTTRWLRGTGLQEATVLSSLFASQLDFVFLIYGLTFVLMAAQCLALHRKDQALPWGLLAASGIIHGINERLDTLAISLPDTFVFKGVGNVCFMAEAS